MVNIEDYNHLVVDIDDTLIYGRFVEFIDLCWRLFKSKTLAGLLMKIQQKFRLYKVNHRVAELIVKSVYRSDIKVTFLTARGKSKYTKKMIGDIFSFDPDIFELVELGSDHPNYDKYDWIDENGLDDVLLIDDNLKTRITCWKICDVMHPGDL